MHQKLVPDPLLILVNNPKEPLHARNYFKNKIFWKRFIKNPKLSQLYFFFRTQSLNVQNYQKQKGPGSSAQLLFRLRNKFKKITLLVISDQVWWCNVKRFLSYFKNWICKFMPVISWHHKFFHFHLSFCIWKVWKGREKNYKRLNISGTKRAFLMKYKTLFIVLEELSFGGKTRIW